MKILTSLIFLSLCFLVQGSPETLQDQVLIKLKVLKEEHETQIQEMIRTIEEQKDMIEACNETIRLLKKLIETG